MSVLRRPARNWGPQRGPRAHVAIAQQASAGATNRRTLREMSLLLRAHGGFTLSSSCDSVTAGTIGDGVDRWDADTDIVGNTPGNAHSWALLGHAVLGQIVLDNDGTADGGGTSGSVWWSPSSAFTGGTNTNRPTATDEIEITSASTFFTTSNGSYDLYVWRCDTAGQESVRLAGIHSSETSGPDVVLVLEKAAATPAAWSSKILARYHSGGNGNGGTRSAWTVTHGYAGLVGVNVRTAILAIGDTPPIALDIDGDRLLVPVGLNEATDARLGFVDDWHFVAAAPTVANLVTFSDEDGTAHWLNLGGSVWPWDGSTQGANVAGAKLLVNYLPSADTTAPVITPVTPQGALPGTREQARYAPITFDITDLTPGLGFTPITIQVGGGRIEVLYLAPKGGFVNGYSGSVTAIANGLRFVVNAPAEGWGTPIVIGPYPVDAAGNLTP